MTDNTASAVVNPAGLHDPVPFGYSHTVKIPTGAELVLVAGQYGSSADGAVVSDVFGEQVRQAFHNVGVALAAHRLDLADVVQLRTYVVDHNLDKLGVITEAVRGRWGANPPTNTVLGVAALATPEVRFEVEAVAARP